jgi:hypothetical protein
LNHLVRYVDRNPEIIISYEIDIIGAHYFGQ